MRRLENQQVAHRMSGEWRGRLIAYAPDFESIVHAVDEGIVVMGCDGSLVYMNPAAMQIFDLESLDEAGEFFVQVLSSPCYYADGSRVPQELHPAALAFRRGSFTKEVYGIELPSGGRRWLLTSGHLLTPGDPTSDMLLSFSDITEERKDLRRLIHQAHHDSLTGLPNRAVVLRKIAEALVLPGRRRLRAVLFIDLDALKATNDMFGHDAGDELLKAAATRLRQCVGPTDVVGRIGGDEFVLLIHGNAMSSDLADWEDRLRGRLAEPVNVVGATVPLRASIGMIEVCRDDARGVEEILRDADIAMYEAKRASRASQ